MKPSAPLTLDGRALPPDLADRFARLIDAVCSVEPSRRTSEIVALAEVALRRTCTLTPNGWTSLRSHALDGGRGPSVRLR